MYVITMQMPAEGDKNQDHRDEDTGREGRGDCVRHCGSERRAEGGSGEDGREADGAVRISRPRGAALDIRAACLVGRIWTFKAPVVLGRGIDDPIGKDH
jgi:hypothetical protein